ncbi:MAG: glutaredoxin [Oscillospiraceae bacterium]|nr:glutaredoxin [Oscillospiraceae bacterium]
MKTIELFYLPGCPYCVKAKKAIAELKEENSDYDHVLVKWIDESEEADYANEHDYYYVPTVYLGEKKIFEAHPGDSLDKIKAGIMKAFDRALHDASGEESLLSGQNSG